METQPTSWLNLNIKPILAIIIVLSVFGYFFMCSLRNLKPDPQILIAMVGTIGIATGFYFGSSSGSSKKDETIANAKGNQTVTGNNPTVNVTPTLSESTTETTSTKQ